MSTIVRVRNGKSGRDKMSLFIYSLFTGIKFNIVGQLSLGDLFCCLEVFKLWFKKRLSSTSDLRKVQIAYFILLISQVVSDFANNSAPQDFLRGWANIIMALLITTFLFSKFFKSPDSIIYLFVGEIFRILIWGSGFEDSGTTEMVYFKFTLVPVLNNIFFIISFLLLSRNRGNWRILVLLLGAFSIICFIFDARSNGLFLFTTATIVLFRKLKKNHINISWGSVTIVSMLAGFVFYFFYVTAVLDEGIGGDHSRQQLNRLENPYNPLNLLKTGRAETFVGMQAVLKKPLVGYGSWAPDRDGSYLDMIFQLQERDVNFYDYYLNSDKKFIIPSHSVLIGAWVTSGVVAFISILYILTLIFKRGWSLICMKNFTDSVFLAIIIFFLLDSVWTFMFSPISHLKLTLPKMIAFILVEYHRATFVGVTSKKN